MAKVKFQSIGLILYAFLMQMAAFGQKPREVQLDNDPPDFSDTTTFIVLVVIPAGLILAYFLLRIRRKRSAEKKD